jgi:hypothetical protein
MKKQIYISKERAVKIAMMHNCIDRATAERYTNSELREVLRHLGIKAKVN